MKLLKWSKKAASKAKKDDQLFLRLFQSEKSVVLTVVDNEGTPIKSGNLLQILDDRKVILIMDCINDDIPLKTDAFDAPLVIQETFMHALRTNYTKCDSIREKVESLGKLKDLLEMISKRK